jgi:putative transposase
MMTVHRSGYYAWCKRPESPRKADDARVLGLIKQAWLESGCVYGYRKVHDELRSWGETSCRNRIARLMKLEKLKSQVGYKQPRYNSGTVANISANLLEQKFTVEHPNHTWVTDITYIRTQEGWLYLAVVIDLFSRQVVGWSMQPRMHTDLVIQALLMAVWRRKPEQKVVMSRRGNCYDNAVAESFFQLLKRERIKRRIYKDREDARHDIFDYIEMFYNPVRRHGYVGNLSPVEFERQHLRQLSSV